MEAVLGLSPSVRYDAQLPGGEVCRSVARSRTCVNCARFFPLLETVHPYNVNIPEDASSALANESVDGKLVLLVVLSCIQQVGKCCQQRVDDTCCSDCEC